PPENPSCPVSHRRSVSHICESSRPVSWLYCTLPTRGETIVAVRCVTYGTTGAASTSALSTAAQRSADPRTSTSIAFSAACIFRSTSSEQNHAVLALVCTPASTRSANGGHPNAGIVKFEADGKSANQPP